jgi:hypothetical protein
VTKDPNAKSVAMAAISAIVVIMVIVLQGFLVQNLIEQPCYVIEGQAECMSMPPRG